MQSSQNESLIKQQQQQQYLHANMQQAKLQQASTNYNQQSYPQPQQQLNINNFNLNNQQDFMMTSVNNKMNDESYRREPLLLKRGYISPWEMISFVSYG